MKKDVSLHYQKTNKMTILTIETSDGRIINSNTESIMQAIIRLENTKEDVVKSTIYTDHTK